MVPAFSLSSFLGFSGRGIKPLWLVCWVSWGVASILSYSNLAEKKICLIPLLLKWSLQTCLIGSDKRSDLLIKRIFCLSELTSETYTSKSEHLKKSGFLPSTIYVEKGEGRKL